MGFLESLGLAAAPGIAAAGGAIAGGLISRDANKDIANEANQLQIYAMQHGISDRVADAKRAGLHPLYALGAPPMNMNPIAIQDTLGPAMVQAGQSIGSSLSRMSSTAEREKEQLELAALRANINESDARRQLLISEAAFKAQAGMISAPAPPLGIHQEGKGPISNPAVSSGQAPNVPAGFYEVKPAPVTSPKVGWPNVAAGINPAYEERWLTPNLPMLLPITQGEGPEELISEMSAPAWLGLLLYNAQIYGPAWLKDMMAFRYGGEAPTNKYDSVYGRKEGTSILRSDAENERKSKKSREQIIQEKIEGAYKHLRKGDWAK